MRLAYQDWILAAWVFRHCRVRYEISVFLAEDHTRCIPDSGTMGALVFNLSNAYYKTGSMQLRFIGPPEGHEETIPESVHRVAKRLGVSLRGGSQIANEEGQRLYVRLTGLSEMALQLFNDRGVGVLGACFAIHRGLWTKEQVELIIRDAYTPARIFAGEIHAEQRLQYMQDICLLRVALLAERLQALCSVVHGPSDQFIRTTWHSQGGITLSLNRPVTLPTLDGKEFVIPPQASFFATLAGRNTSAYELHAESDIAKAAAASPPRALVVTHDFERTPDLVRRQLFTLARRSKVAMIGVADTLSEVDAEINQRLARSASTERSVPERPD